MHEIITSNDNLIVSFEGSLLYEKLHPYIKSLYTYYKDLFCCEPVLMITDVFNAAQYCLIVPENEFSECLELYKQAANLEDSDIEEISFNSKMLKDLL